MMKGLGYIFPSLFKTMAAERRFEKVYSYHESGDIAEALRLCKELVEEYPCNVYYRRELIALQRSLGQEVSLPDITPKNKPKPGWW